MEGFAGAECEGINQQAHTATSLYQQKVSASLGGRSVHIHHPYLQPTGCRIDTGMEPLL